MNDSKVEIKNCLTCRARKKGGRCDKKRPICGQCVTLGLVCEWSKPRTTVTFVHTDPSRPKIRTRKSSPVHVGLDESLARGGYEAGYQGDFWNSYLPQGQELPRHVTRYINGGWTQAIPQVCTESQAARKILLALCLFSSGAGAGRPWERQEGMRFYAESLRDMAVTVAKPQPTDLAALIVTSRLYGIYEIVFGSVATDKLVQAQSWRRHSVGELALITSQPPETYRSGFLHQVFVDGRFGLTTAAIHKREKFILSEPKWKIIPWGDAPKTSKDRLMDIFVDVPTVLEEMDIMKECTDEPRQEQIRLAVARKFRTLERDLLDWWEWSNMGEPLHAPSEPPPTVDDLAELYILCLYWAICIIVYSSLTIIDVAADCSSPTCADPISYCQKIARATQTLLNPSAKAGWVHMPNFPISVALGYLNATGADSVAQERLMIAEATGKSRYGRTVNDFVESLHRDHGSAGEMPGKSESHAAKVRARSWFGMDNT